MASELRPPRGLIWEESEARDEWRGRAETAFSGQQALGTIGLLLVAVITVPIAIASRSPLAIAIAGANVVGIPIVATRRRRALQLRLAADGLTIDGRAIAPLASIAELGVMREERVAMPPNDLLLVRLRDGGVREIELAERDPVYLRFIAARLNAALAARRERYRE